MSLPPILLFVFGSPGPLLQRSIQDAADQGIDVTPIVLDGSVDMLGKAAPDFWRQIREVLEGKDRHLVIWTDDAMIVWDRLERAWNVNHRPDFLWPLVLRLDGGSLSPSQSRLYLATGGFEMSLFSFRDLGSFHHMTTARALVKLLTVNPLESFNLHVYLGSIWTNFETVKVPDTWLIQSAASKLDFANSHLGRDLDTSSKEFQSGHRQWQMAREALNVRTRNTLAAADFVRSNLDVMAPYVQTLAQNLPYHGFWPIKTRRGGFMTLPCTGFHPVVTAHIWLGDYHPFAVDLWNNFLCGGGHHTVIDMRQDGHFFGLLHIHQNASSNAVFVGSDLANMARAQAGLDINQIGLKRVTFTDELPDMSESLVALHAHQTTQSILDRHDLFIPIDNEADLSALRSLTIPSHMTLYILASERPEISTHETLQGVVQASAVIIMKKDRATALFGRT